MRDQSGRRGGLFVSEAEAFRFAKFETGRRSSAIVLVPGPLELDMSDSSMPAANDSTNRSPFRTGVAPFERRRAPAAS